jgi:hypothetical protein
VVHDNQIAQSPACRFRPLFIVVVDRRLFSSENEKPLLIDLPLWSPLTGCVLFIEISSANSFQSIEKVLEAEHLEIHSVADTFRDELKKKLQKLFFSVLFEELNAADNLIFMEILKKTHKKREGTPR